MVFGVLTRRRQSGKLPDDAQSTTEPARAAQQTTPPDGHLVMRDAIMSLLSTYPDTVCSIGREPNGPIKGVRIFSKACGTTTNFS
jgi:hypothetical protein